MASNNGDADSGFADHNPPHLDEADMENSPPSSKFSPNSHTNSSLNEDLTPINDMPPGLDANISDLHSASESMSSSPGHCTRSSIASTGTSNTGSGHHVKFNVEDKELSPGDSGSAADPQQCRKSHEERLREIKRQQDESRRRKLEEMKQNQRLAQKYREQQQEIRRSRIEEQKAKETQHRQRVEERRRRMEQQELERREAMLKRLENREQHTSGASANRSKPSYAFGSSTDRFFDPLDNTRRSQSQSAQAAGSRAAGDSALSPQRRAASAWSLARARERPAMYTSSSCLYAERTAAMPTRRAISSLRLNDLAADIPAGLPMSSSYHAAMPVTRRAHEACLLPCEDVYSSFRPPSRESRSRVRSRSAFGRGTPQGTPSGRREFKSNERGSAKDSATRLKQSRELPSSLRQTIDRLSTPKKSTQQRGGLPTSSASSSPAASIISASSCSKSPPRTQTSSTRKVQISKPPSGHGLSAEQQRVKRTRSEERKKVRTAASDPLAGVTSMTGSLQVPKSSAPPARRNGSSRRKPPLPITSTAQSADAESGVSTLPTQRRLNAAISTPRLSTITTKPSVTSKRNLPSKSADTRRTTNLRSKSKSAVDLRSKPGTLSTEKPAHPKRDPSPAVPASADRPAASTDDEREGKASIQELEEYKAKLREQRRKAREEAERKQAEEAALEEAKRKAEEERARELAEHLKRAEIARQAEQEEEKRRLEQMRKAEQEQREREEKERLEAVAAQREAEAKNKEAAEKAEAERQEKLRIALQKEEEERLDRKKRLESIMKRVKTDSPEHRSSPSTSTANLAAMDNKPTTVVDPNEPTNAPAADHIESGANATSVANATDGAAVSTGETTTPSDGTAKFKSPLLQKVLAKREITKGLLVKHGATSAPTSDSAVLDDLDSTPDLDGSISESLEQSSPEQKFNETSTAEFSTDDSSQNISESLGISPLSADNKVNTELTDVKVPFEDNAEINEPLPNPVGSAQDELVEVNVDEKDSTSINEKTSFNEKEQQLAGESPSQAGEIETELADIKNDKLDVAENSETVNEKSLSSVVATDKGHIVVPSDANQPVVDGTEVEPVDENCAKTLDDSPGIAENCESPDQELLSPMHSGLVESVIDKYADHNVLPTDLNLRDSEHDNQSPESAQDHNDEAQSVAVGSPNNLGNRIVPAESCFHDLHVDANHDDSYEPVRSAKNSAVDVPVDEVISSPLKEDHVVLTDDVAHCTMESEPPEKQGAEQLHHLNESVSDQLKSMDPSDENVAAEEVNAEVSNHSGLYDHEAPKTEVSDCLIENDAQHNVSVDDGVSEVVLDSANADEANTVQANTANTLNESMVDVETAEMTTANAEVPPNNEISGDSAYLYNEPEDWNKPDVSENSDVELQADEVVDSAVKHITDPLRFDLSDQQADSLAPQLSPIPNAGAVDDNHQSFDSLKEEHIDPNIMSTTEPPKEATNNTMDDLTDGLHNLVIRSPDTTGSEEVHINPVFDNPNHVDLNEDLKDDASVPPPMHTSETTDKGFEPDADIIISQPPTGQPDSKEEDSFATPSNNNEANLNRTDLSDNSRFMTALESTANETLSQSAHDVPALDGSYISPDSADESNRLPFRVPVNVDPLQSLVEDAGDNSAEVNGFHNEIEAETIKNSKPDTFPTTRSDAQVNGHRVDSSGAVDTDANLDQIIDLSKEIPDKTKTETLVPERSETLIAYDRNDGETTF